MDSQQVFDILSSQSQCSPPSSPASQQQQQQQTVQRQAAKDVIQHANPAQLSLARRICSIYKYSDIRAFCYKHGIRQVGTAYDMALRSVVSLDIQVVLTWMQQSKRS